MADEIVDVVDENDRVIRSVKRSTVTDADILRCASVFLINDKKEILLQLRSKTVKFYPSHWDIGVGGHLQSGDSYLEGAKREMMEEVGVKTELEPLGKYLFEADGGRRYFSAVFKGNFSGSLKIDPGEVSEARFFSLAEVRMMIARGEKFHPECLFALKKFFLI